MEVDKLTTTELFTAGTIITKVAEEIEKTDTDENTEKSMKYILRKMDDINKEIAEEILIRLKASMDQIRKQIEDTPKEEKKIPEKFKINYEIDEEDTINMKKATMLECDLACRINEILDYLDYLKSKGE